MLSGTGSPQKYEMFLWGKESKHPLVVPKKLRGDFIVCRHALTAYVSISRSLRDVTQTRRTACISALIQSLYNRSDKASVHS